MPYSLRGKVAIVTGANQGLGFEISRRYLQAGASVVMCARNGELLKSAQKDLTSEIAKEFASEQIVEAFSTDVSDLQSTERLVKVTLEHFGRIDILVNNAGILGPIGPAGDVDWAQWIRAIEINLFGSILMCRAVLPTMKARQKGKIVQLSGGGATQPLPNISAYAVSKAAIVRFSDTLAEEVRDFNIDVNAIAPGFLNTRMLDEVLASGPEKVGRAYFDRVMKQKESGGAGLDRGADVAVFLASDASNGITGKLISALWDNWEHWPEHIDELRASDVYSLRRITGRDRSYAWGDK